MKARQAKKILSKWCKAERVLVPPGHILCITVKGEDIDVDTLSALLSLAQNVYGRRVLVICSSSGQEIKITSTPMTDAESTTSPVEE